MTKEFYDKLADTYREGDDDVDYKALDQGITNTLLRHAQVLKHMPASTISGKSFVDLGCGTGLLIPFMRERGAKPSHYIGVDFIEERRFYVDTRAEANGWMHTFVQDDVMSYLSKQHTYAYHNIVAVGLVGNMPFESMSKVAALIKEMQRVGKHGVVTAPRPYKDFLGCTYQAHFDPEDMQTILQAKVGLNFGTELHSEREMTIYW